jgi:hypothetical protein
MAKPIIIRLTAESATLLPPVKILLEEADYEEGLLDFNEIIKGYVTQGYNTVTLEIVTDAFGWV